MGVYDFTPRHKAAGLLQDRRDQEHPRGENCFTRRQFRCRSRHSSIELDVIVFERHGPQIRITPGRRTVVPKSPSRRSRGIDNLAQTFASKVDASTAELTTIVAGESTIPLPAAGIRLLLSRPSPRYSHQTVERTGRDGLIDALRRR